MSAWQIDEAVTENSWPTAPANVPRDAADLDSGIMTPFSSLNPERELWVATYGTDTDPGTLFEPKRTIGAALALATPGTAIMVKGGVYRESLTLNGTAGTTGKPIWLRSADGKGAAEMAPLTAGQPALTMTAVSTVIVEGFRINGGAIVEPSATKSSSVVILQNNIITNGVNDGLRVEMALTLYLIGNDVSASPRGHGISVSGSYNVLIADNYVHDLRTGAGVNNGIHVRGDIQNALLQNNLVERVEGTAVHAEGKDVIVRANTLRGGRRGAAFAGCTGCRLERNDIAQAAANPNDVVLSIGDSLYPTANVTLTGNCVARTNWLLIEPGSVTGLVNQNNTTQACH